LVQKVQYRLVEALLGLEVDQMADPLEHFDLRVWQLGGELLCVVVLANEKQDGLREQRDFSRQINLVGIDVGREPARIFGAAADAGAGFDIRIKRG
jgi:hypothetical protein